MVPRQPSRFNLADPDVILSSALCFLQFQALLRLSFDQWPDACVLVRVLVVTHRSTDGPTPDSMPNVEELHVLLGSVP